MCEDTSKKGIGFTTESRQKNSHFTPMKEPGISKKGQETPQNSSLVPAFPSEL
jgi:hypothetical protein